MTTPAPAAPEGTTADPGTQPANPPTPPAAPTAPAQPEPAAPTTEPSEPNQPEPKAKAPKFEGDFDPARFEKLVENLRGDVAAERAKREALEQKAKDDQDALMKRVATAFGLETDEAKPPTPEELAKQLDEARGETKESRAQARQTQVELAVYKTAGKHGGDPDALLDSRSFANAISKLDPTAADFDEQVGKAVKTAVDSNKKLAAKAPEPKEPEPTPAGGAPMDGAGGSKKQLGEADVARMTPKQINQAMTEGRLDRYLGRAG
ncbi:hypothetical protein GTY83_07020 [Streptomyces sp. SID4928]|uniref:hypothetical protein n=1 Tax=Streptomyces TaxID=1883 RepID=UPI0001C1CEF8|nr:hypothetical protein [Streptomyces sp. ACT-1]EGE40782.1 phage minor structural protein [Streptomyces sp. ACT-1]MYR48856.1 hypothetical protein [Streptomyces sp. SID4928]